MECTRLEVIDAERNPVCLLSTNGFKVKLAKADGFNPEEILKLYKAIELWERAWNSREFEQWLLNYRWQKKVTAGMLWWKKTVLHAGEGFRLTYGRTQSEILALMKSGKERNETEADGEFDLSIIIDRRAVTGVIGYTYPNSIHQWVYANFFKRATPAEIAGNLAHEAMHRYGFGHEYQATALREFTVPYAVGYETARLAKLYSNGNA